MRGQGMQRARIGSTRLAKCSKNLHVHRMCGLSLIVPKCAGQNIRYFCLGDSDVRAHPLLRIGGAVPYTLVFLRLDSDGTPCNHELVHVHSTTVGKLVVAGVVVHYGFNVSVRTIAHALVTVVIKPF
jgi:hypothetical protein